MTPYSIGKLLLAILAGSLIAMRSDAAICGLQGSATGQASVYNPFLGGALPKSRISLNVTRINPTGGGRTALVAFYLTARTATAANNVAINAVSFQPTGGINIYGLNQNIFYNTGSAAPSLLLNTRTPVGYAIVDFGGNTSGSDNLTLTFDIALPANLDVAASSRLAFDLNYRCSGAGGGKPFEETGSITDALSFPIKVLSGLEASYSGHVLDFGEVGTMTDADISKNQIAFTKSGWVNVRSSGAFTLKLTSQNGYRLTFPGGDLSKTSQTLRYTARLAGTAMTSNGSSTATISCVRAGLTTLQIPISAELNEGGSLKAASSSYSDILSITVSPEMADASGATQCAN
jgi:hypothetical protein